VSKLSLPHPDAIGVRVGRPTRRLPADAHASVDAAWDHADGWAKAQLSQAIRWLASAGRPFTTDDIDRSIVDVRPAQVGAAVRAAALAGVIRPTGVARPSARPEAHGRLVREWIGAAVAPSGGEAA